MSFFGPFYILINVLYFFCYLFSRSVVSQKNGKFCSSSCDVSKSPQLNWHHIGNGQLRSNIHGLFMTAYENTGQMLHSSQQGVFIKPFFYMVNSSLQDWKFLKPMSALSQHLHVEPVTRPKAKATCTHCLVRYKGAPLYLNVCSLPSLWRIHASTKLNEAHPAPEHVFLPHWIKTRFIFVIFQTTTKKQVVRWVQDCLMKMVFEWFSFLFESGILYALIHVRIMTFLSAHKFHNPPQPPPPLHLHHSCSFSCPVSFPVPVPPTHQSGPAWSLVFTPGGWLSLLVTSSCSWLLGVFPGHWLLLLVVGALPWSVTGCLIVFWLGSTLCLIRMTQRMWSLVVAPGSRLSLLVIGSCSRLSVISSFCHIDWIHQQAIGPITLSSFNHPIHPHQQTPHLLFNITSHLVQLQPVFLALSRGGVSELWNSSLLTCCPYNLNHNPPYFSTIPVPVPVLSPFHIVPVPCSSYLFLVPVTFPVLFIVWAVLLCLLSRPALDLARGLSSCGYLSLLLMDEINYRSSRLERRQFKHTPKTVETVWRQSSRLGRQRLKHTPEYQGGVEEKTEKKLRRNTTGNREFKPNRTAGESFKLNTFNLTPLKLLFPLKIPTEILKIHVIIMLLVQAFHYHVCAVLNLSQVTESLCWNPLCCLSPSSVLHSIPRSLTLSSHLSGLIQFPSSSVLAQHSACPLQSIKLALNHFHRSLSSLLALAQCQLATMQSQTVIVQTEIN
ncbi:putative signal peptide protein [Puccinia sorghi]|uniref:Putative signal peptide protein n=1 Tax=Puccinia sorghi TaxID=27349 RepID=A0A0L6V9S9_9BASI|nr:putative signal peptide protein [Puccinia sorghi]